MTGLLRWAWENAPYEFSSRHFLVAVPFPWGVEIESGVSQHSPGESCGIRNSRGISWSGNADLDLWGFNLPLKISREREVQREHLLSKRNPYKLPRAAQPTFCHRAMNVPNWVERSSHLPGSCVSEGEHGTTLCQFPREFFPRRASHQMT